MSVDELLTLVMISPPPLQYTRSLWGHPDTPQTPYRHSADTPRHLKIWYLGHWKRIFLTRSKIVPKYYRCLWFIFLPLRHLPDTNNSPDNPQTSPRHPTETLKFWPIQGIWQKWNKLMKMSHLDVLIACTSYPPRHSDNPQTPPRQIPDTFQTPRNMAQVWPIQGN